MKQCGVIINHYNNGFVVCFLFKSLYVCIWPLPTWIILCTTLVFIAKYTDNDIYFWFFRPLLPTSPCRYILLQINRPFLYVKGNKYRGNIPCKYDADVLDLTVIFLYILYWKHEACVLNMYAVLFMDYKYCVKNKWSRVL